MGTGPSYQDIDWEYISIRYTDEQSQLLKEIEQIEHSKLCSA